MVAPRRIVSYLTEELVLSATMSPCLRAAIRSRRPTCALRAEGVAARRSVRDPIPYYMLMLDRVRRARRRVRHPAFPYRPVSISAVPLDRAAARSPRCTAARTCPTSCRSISASTTCRWFRSPTLSASPVPNANFAATVYHGLPLDLHRPDCEPQRRLCRLSRPHLAGEAARPRHRDRARARHSAEDRRQGRQGRRSLFSDDDRAAARRARRRIHRRDQRAPEDANSSARRGRCCFPIDWPEPFGLVHDRGHGLRHAGAGVPLRLGAGDHRRRRHRR